MNCDERMAAINRFIFIGPVLIVLAWFLAGQWMLAGPEAQAWLQFAGVVCLVSLMPLPGAPQSLSDLAVRVQWLGWLVVAGLVATS
jgi:hypothetical protein